MTDGSLVRAARAGDRRAFAALIDRHWPLLAGCCRRMLGAGAGDLAEEAAQESVLQAMLGLDRLREPDRFGPWLAGIGLNVCRQLLRQRAASSWSPEAAVDLASAGRGSDPQELAEAAELAARVRRAVQALPAGQRQAVALCYLAGLTQREVAAALGIDVGAVKGRLHKARLALRRRLVRYEEVDVAHVNADDAVEVRVADVLRYRVEGDEPRHVVVLQEVGGERRMRVWVGPFEATWLAVHLENVQLPRPGTYAFAAGLLEAAAGTLDEVRINRLTDEVFYAEARVTAAGRSHVVDARPSDALNLALLMGRPVRVERAVLDLASATADATGEPPEGAARIASDAFARMRRPAPPSPAP